MDEIINNISNTRNNRKIKKKQKNNNISNFVSIATKKSVSPQKYNICWKPKLKREH